MGLPTGQHGLGLALPVLTLVSKLFSVRATSKDSLTV